MPSSKRRNIHWDIPEIFRISLEFPSVLDEKIRAMRMDFEPWKWNEIFKTGVCGG